MEFHASLRSGGLVSPPEFASMIGGMFLFELPLLQILASVFQRRNQWPIGHSLLNLLLNASADPHLATDLPRSGACPTLLDASSLRMGDWERR